MRGLRAPISLRGQVSALFALGALIVSVLVGLSTAVVTHSVMLEQRQRTSQRQTAVHAAVVAEVVTTAPRTLDETLRSLDRPIASYSLVHVDGRWHGSLPAADPGDLPASLVAAATGGRAATARVTLPTGPSLVVARPLPAPGAGYIEVFGLADIEQTRRVLALVVVAVGVVVTVVATILGRWVVTVALRPVNVLTRAAAKVAAGDLTVAVRPGRADDLRTLADAFNRTVAALRRRVERDERFAGDVSHELRNPLTTMVNAVQLLEARRDELPAGTGEVLDLLADEMRRFERTVVDLLEISAAPNSPFAGEPVRLADLVRDVADTAAGRPVTHVAPQLEELTVHGDRRRLERVVANLVDNAVRHGGGVRGVYLTADASTARITVDDHGGGVAPDQRERIFERFTRLDSGGRAEGTGLGLAIVAEHVRRHAGEVSVQEGPNGGARFVVRLPLGPDAARALPHPSA